MTALSNEIMAQVFHYLSPIDMVKSVPFVCKQWNNMANDITPYLLVSKESPPEGILDVLSCKRNIHALQFYRFKGINDEDENGNSVLERILNHCRVHTVNCVYFDYSDIDNRIFMSALKKIPSLTHISLESCALLRDDAVELLCQKNPNIVSLNLMNCLLFSASIDSIANHLTRLRRLNIANLSTEMESVQRLIDLRANILEEIWLEVESALNFSHCTSLRRFWARFGKHDADETLNSLSQVASLERLTIAEGRRILKESLRDLFSLRDSQLRQLTHVCFCHCPNLDDTVLQDLVHLVGTQLQSVRFQNVQKVTDDGLEYLIERCRQLRRLSLVELKYCNGSSLHKLLTFCQKLVFLSLKGCEAIEPQVIRFLTLNLETVVIVGISGMAISPLPLPIEETALKHSIFGPRFHLFDGDNKMFETCLF